MDDLVQFLRDRLDEAREKEEGKRRSVPSPGPFFGHEVVIEHSADKGVTVLVDGQPYPEEQYWEIATEPAPDAFIVADIEAKRRIVEEFEQATRYAKTTWGQSNADQARARTLSKVARLLALPYADHADYRSEWAS